MQLHAHGLHALQKVVVLGLKTADGAGAIGQQHYVAGEWGWGVFQQVFQGGAHTVAAGFARHDQALRLQQGVQQWLVQAGLRSGGVWHFGLQRAVVFGPRVHAFEDVAHGALLLALPVTTGGQNVGVHAMAPAADFAVHGPDHQGVAPTGFQCIQVRQGLLKVLRLAWRKSPGAHLCRRDGREGGNGTTIGLLPERRVGNIEHLVGVQRDGDVINLCTAAAQPLGHPLHVGMCTGYGQRRAQALRAPGGRQVTEIVLRVDQQQLGVRRHGRQGTANKECARV